MPNLIYQYWNGPVPPGSIYSGRLISAYAENIGADYRFDHDDNYTGKHAKYFDVMRPVLDEGFHHYDKVLFLDMDIYPVAGLTADVFEEPVADIGMCEEPGMPEYRDGRQKHINGQADHDWAKRVKKRWGSIIPLDAKGRVRVFNSGVVMYSQAGMVNCRRLFVPIDDYIQVIHGTKRMSGFYAMDQNYLDAMVHMEGVDFTELPVEWNRQVHGKDDGSRYDERTPDTNFVHIQLSGADDWDDAALDKIVNP